MKRIPRAPFFEIGIKNYLYGDEVLRLAQAADQAAIKYDIDVLFGVPYTEIRRVSQQTERLIILAPYMDLLKPGRGMADVLPEALKAAGAQGVVINHCERPVSLNQLKRTIDRANEIDFISFVCTDSIAEARAAAELGPDIINPEPTELVGTGNTTSMDFVHKSIQAVKAVNPAILVELAAGITSAQQVYDIILAGADAAGAASGICTNTDPEKTATSMIEAVHAAIHDAGQR